MKKKLVQKLLFLAIVYSSTFYSSPVLGENYHIKTDVAVQEETTNLRAGISSMMIEHMNSATIEEYYNGWTTTNVNVRNEPSTDSEVLEVYSCNTPIQYYRFNDEWAKIVYPTGYAYISLQYISNEK